jgi:GNAT superfamily N-acetyltransferase
VSRCEYEPELSAIREADTSAQGNLLEPLSRAAMTVHALLWLNRAADPAKKDILERAYPFFKHLWAGEREEAWYLDTLAVDPNVQGTGIGRKLTEWGLDHATRDGIYASVISAKGKEGFYYKVGFEFELGSAAMGEGNPMTNLEGGKMLWRNPPWK